MIIRLPNPLVAPGSLKVELLVSSKIAGADMFMTICRSKINRDKLAKDLKDEYERRGRPGQDGFLKLVRQTEIDLSKNLQFEVVKRDDKLCLRCDRKGVVLPTNVKWHDKVYIHPKTKVLCVTDGADTSKPCVTFFQNEQDYSDEFYKGDTMARIDAKALLTGQLEAGCKVFNWSDMPAPPTTGAASMAGLANSPGPENH